MKRQLITNSDKIGIQLEYVLLLEQTMFNILPKLREILKTFLSKQILGDFFGNSVIIVDRRNHLRRFVQCPTFKIC
uniref:Uncharacterized protein n=1 Tax=Megaselia scalaris TaxID=36166 RepID=T1GJL4_MEGSC